MTDQTTEKGKATAKTTFVSFLLDETGSMASIKDDTIGGFNEYVRTLQTSGGDILFSLVTFNSSRTERRYVAEPIADVAPLADADYRPHASTPLIDASVKIIRATEEAVERRGDDPNVVIVIQTDGQENVSVEYDSRDLAALVKDKEAAGWEFVFLGAGMDAFDAAQQAGMAIPANRVMSYGRHLSAPAFEHAAMNVAEYAVGASPDALDFRQDQRDDAGDEYHGRRGGESGKGHKSRRGGRSSPTGRDSEGASTVDDFEL